METEFFTSPHLTEQEIVQYQQRRVSSENLFAFAEHLHHCHTCHTRLKCEQKLAATTHLLTQELSTAMGEPCDFLTWEQKTDFADGKLQGEDNYWVETHLEICPECQGEIRAYQTLQAQIQPARIIAPHPTSTWFTHWKEYWTVPQFRFPIQIGAAAALVGVSVWVTTVYWQMKTTPLTQQIAQLTEENNRTHQQVAKVAELEQQLARLQKQPSTAEREKLPTVSSPNLVTLTDGQQQIALNQAGQITGLSIPTGYEAAIKLALEQQQLARPASLKGLTGPGGALMSPDQTQPDFMLLSPFKKNVASPQPTFRWRPLAEATNYTVTIYDERLQEVARSEKLTATEWTAPQPLPRGKVYLWQVRALKEEKEIISPPPHAPNAKFRILSQKQQEELEQLLHQTADSHLLKGIIYTNYGLLDEAQQEFQILANANPNSPVARGLLQQSNRLR